MDGSRMGCLNERKAGLVLRPNAHQKPADQHRCPPKQGRLAQGTGHDDTIWGHEINAN